MFVCEQCEIFKNSFFYRTSLVAASGWPEIILVDTMMLKSELTHRCDFAPSKKKNLKKWYQLHRRTWFLWGWCRVVKAVCRRWSMKKELKNSQIHKKTQVFQSLSNKPAGLKKRLQHRLFSCEFYQIFKTPILWNINDRLLLEL